MASSTAKQPIVYDASDPAFTGWTPSGLSALAGTAPPVPAGGISPVGYTLDLYTELGQTWPGFYARVPNMGIPATSTLLGFQIDIYCQKNNSFGLIWNLEDLTGQYAGVIGLVQGNAIDLTAFDGYESLIGSPRSHIDQFPVGIGNVTPDRKITLGGPTELWGKTAAALKAQLNNNTGSGQLGVWCDIGTYENQDGFDSRTERKTAGTVATIQAGNWTGDPTTIIPANSFSNTSGGAWATKAVHNLTTQGQTFGGLTVQFGSIALADDFVPTGVEVRFYGQSIGVTEGRVTVDGTSTGSKTVQHAGQMGITKGSTVAYANLMANGGGKTRKRHIDDVTNSFGDVNTTKVLTFGDSSDLLGFADAAALKAQLTNNTGSSMIGFLIDDGIFWRDGNNATREISCIELVVYGHGPGVTTRREIAMIVCTAFYSSPSLLETVTNVCSQIWTTYKATQTKHGIRLYVPNAAAPNAWAVNDPQAAGDQGVERLNQFYFDVDISSYVKMQQSARALVAILDDYKVSQLDCTPINSNLGITVID